MNKLFLVLIAFSVLLHSAESFAQSKASGATAQQKKAEKKKAEQKKKAAKAEMKAKKHHEKIQTKEVRKRMKKHKKQATTPYKKPNFFQRTFKKKQALWLQSPFKEQHPLYFECCNQMVYIGKCSLKIKA